MSIFVGELTRYSFLSFFEEITRIPRGSRNSKMIAEYLVSFARERGLEYRRDEADNVIIKKKGTRSQGDHTTVILQGHTDIVVAKDEGCNKNTLCEGVDAYLDGDLIKAHGTTLGADNGIAIAYALAVLDSNTLIHPDIEALFTSDEEIGMVGAMALDASDLSGKILINLDSEEEGYFTVGCAGGVCATVSLSAAKEKVVSPCKRITVSGVRGGHSGTKIHKGGANAIRILSSLLEDIRGIKIAGINGGNADNAIPVEAYATVYADGENDIALIVERIYERYKQKEPDLSITVTPQEDSYCFGREDSRRLIALVNTIPNGIIKMSEDIDGLVETSLNLGVIASREDGVTLSYAIRSSKAGEKAKLVNEVNQAAKSLGASVSLDGDYPGWEYKKVSPIRDLMCRVYRKQYGKEPIIMAIHAGLECGILSEKLNGLDCISIGPDISSPHTVSENLSVSSSIRVWSFLTEVLREI